MNPPPDGEQGLDGAAVLQLFLDLANEVFPLLVDGVLGIE
jgi:hypothetical protein